MTESPHITDVGQADFAQRVVEKSNEIPVLVDFWAPWCGPCRMLGPLLERLVQDYGGKLHLAKVNTDVEQTLATQFHIRGIPAVKLFRRGEVVGEFVGVQPESAVRALVEPFLPGPADALIEQSAALAGAGRVDEAATLLRDALARGENDDRIKIALVKLLLGHTGDEDDHDRVTECDALLGSLSIRSSADPDTESLHARLDLLRAVAGAPPAEELGRAIAADPDDAAARFRLGARLALAGDYDQAMEQFLELVRRDRSFGDDAARKALVGLFKVLGARHPLVAKYRGLLSRALN